MKILIAGGSGLIGSALIPFLRAQGHTVEGLKRGVDYNPEEGMIHLERLEGCDVLINLAGESVAKRWTASRKEQIKDSRVKTTKLLSEAASRMKWPPQIIINASAIGFYGERGEQTVNEDSPPGEGFLPEVTQAWEQALEPAQIAGIRIVKLRFGMVLSAKGGALARMLPAFKMGLGGKLGTGEQFMSWIAIEDVLGVIFHVLSQKEIQGAINVVAPQSVRNLEFTKTLGEILKRPTVLTVPAFAIKLLFGQMGDELLLASTKVSPKYLLDTGYPFLYPSLDQALHHQLIA